MAEQARSKQTFAEVLARFEMGACVLNAQRVSGCIQGTVLCSAPPANWYRVGATLKSALRSSEAYKVGCSSIKRVQHCTVLLCTSLWDSPAQGNSGWVFFPNALHSVCHATPLTLHILPVR